MKLQELLTMPLYGDAGQSLGAVGAICWARGKSCSIQTQDGCFVGERASVKRGKLQLVSPQKVEQGCKLLLGKNVYDNGGGFVGELQDAEVSRGLKLRSIEVAGKTISLGSIVANGDVIIIKAPQPKSVAKQKVQQKSTPLGASEETGRKSTANHLRPRRRYGDFSFLVGRRVDKTILNFLGEVMIRQNEVITRAVYLQAKKFGKLTELCLHAQ